MMGTPWCLQNLLTALGTLAAAILRVGAAAARRARGRAGAGVGAAHALRAVVSAAVGIRPARAAVAAGGSAS